MVTAVAARFHFDGEEWPLSRLERWYNRHVFAYNEEQAEIARQKAALKEELSKNGRR